MAIDGGFPPLAEEYVLFSHVGLKKDSSLDIFSHFFLGPAHSHLQTHLDPGCGRSQAEAYGTRSASSARQIPLAGGPR